MPWVAGIDGCESQWFVVLREIDSRRIVRRVIRSIAEALTFSESPTVIAVDCPIGLLDQAVPGGRECDRIARALLGFPRAAGVFPIPARSALLARDYHEACAINAKSSAFGKRLSRQTFGLFPKLREIDEFITPDRQKRVVEAHPELCFFEINGCCAVKDGKKTPQGQETRRLLLFEAGLIDSADAERPSGVGIDDVFDAYVLSWTAERIACGRGKRIPETPSLDSKGLRMEMWR